MKHFLLSMIFLVSTLAGCTEQHCSTAQPCDESKSSFKKWFKDEFWKDAPQPRIVPKGAKPELIVKGKEIWLNGKLLPLGGTVEEWKKLMPGEAKCVENRLFVHCQWHSLGLSSGTNMEDTTRFHHITVHLNLPPKTKSYASMYPDGTPMEPLPDIGIKNPFLGYLEIDGFGIDAQTQFWEILQSVNPKRRLRCGLRDCQYPLGEGLEFSLDRRSERGLVERVEIDGDLSFEP
jgi:hypothetical protein